MQYAVNSKYKLFREKKQQQVLTVSVLKLYLLSKITVPLFIY